MDKKKAEVRKRMEEQSMKKKKKGFMTPERKKKLRLLLRKKAAEELKKEQERKSAERRKVIDQRCGKPSSTDGMSESKYLVLLIFWPFSLLWLLRRRIESFVPNLSRQDLCHWEWQIRHWKKGRIQRLWGEFFAWKFKGEIFNIFFFNF